MCLCMRGNLTIFAYLAAPLSGGVLSGHLSTFRNFSDRSTSYKKARIIGILGYIICLTDWFKISNINDKERRFNSRPLHIGAINYLCERPLFT